jgi:hypothetical protein
MTHGGLFGSNLDGQIIAAWKAHRDAIVCTVIKGYASFICRAQQGQDVL